MKKSIFILIALLFVMPLFAQETFKVPEMTLNQKYDQALGNLDYVIIVGIDYVKSQGGVAADYGKYMGSKIAPMWDKNAGFNGFVYGVMYNLLSFQNAPEMTLMVNNPDKVKVKIHLMAQWLKNQGGVLNVTHKDYLECVAAVFNEIADYMGAKCEITSDDNWMYVMMAKK